jgi:uncharacterized membrane protein YphA (DoxX/SURF4 family)
MDQTLIEPTQPWTPTQKGGFRFFCCFFLLYIFPFPLNSIPFVNELSGISEKLTGWYNAVFDAYTNMWHAIIVWIAKNILHLSYPITVFSNGSGDTTYDYVLLLTHFLLALLATIIWSLLDKNRESYRKGYYWLRVLVRYFLIVNMLGYGFAKVFHLQMPFPYLSQLVQPFGDKSPMGLAWSFIGYSKLYSAFSGWCEVLGGLLLIFRRTTTLGALVSAVVMFNVVIMNFSYDIPVKLYSSILFLMAVFLLAPDTQRLLNVLWFNQPALPVIRLQNRFSKRWLHITARSLKWIFILYALWSGIYGSLQSQQQYGDKAPRPPLYGIYNVATIVKNNDTMPLLLTDTTLWKQLVIQRAKSATVKLMNDTMRRYNFVVDTAARSATVYADADTLNKSTLFYTTDAAAITLRGQWKKDTVYMRFTKYDVNRFRLVNRGFNWINEYPFNR